VLVIAAILVLRWRADLRRPLVLPRLAGLLNRQPLRMRFGVIGALCLAAGLVIALNGGLSWTMKPSGAVCAIAPVSCAVVQSVPATVGTSPHSASDHKHRKPHRH
jgi:hypothetical protein